ncbi:hypothetical protein, partial [Oceanithermus sp.]
TKLRKRHLMGVVRGGGGGWIAGAVTPPTALGAALAGLLPGAWNPAVPALAAALAGAGWVGLARAGRQ